MNHKGDCRCIACGGAFPDPEPAKDGQQYAPPPPIYESATPKPPRRFREAIHRRNRKLQGIFDRPAKVNVG